MGDQMQTAIIRFLGEWVVPPAYIRILRERIQIRSEPAPKWVEILDGPLRGRQMLLNLDSSEFWQREMAEGRYDLFFYESLSRYGGIEGATVWDIGAHIGYHSLTSAALVGPSGHIVAFEPNPHNVERFQKNLERNPDLGRRIALMTCALSDTDGEAQFVFSSEVDNGRSSGSHLQKALVPLEQDVYRSFSQTTVTTVKADTLLRDKHVPVPSVIKIDVEGAEQFVLEGAVKLLSTHEPLLFIEVHNVTVMFQVQKLLFSLGYTMDMLDAENSTLSRCFVLARPRGR